jgi:hypothetical protein
MARKYERQRERTLEANEMTEKRKEKPPQVIDLPGDVKDAEIITVARRLYRVREDVLEAKPEDYSPAPLENVLLKRYCVVCGFELGHPENFSPYMRKEDCRCVVHRQPDEGRRTTPRCVYCSQEMLCVLPFEVPLHSLRYLWVCPDRHCHVVSDSMEGIR